MNEAPELKLLSVEQAAKKIGICKSRVRALLATKQISGHKVGTVWVITKEEVERFKKMERPSGRPRLQDSLSRAYGDFRGGDR